MEFSLDSKINNTKPDKTSPRTFNSCGYSEENPIRQRVATQSSGS